MNRGVIYSGLRIRRRLKHYHGYIFSGNVKLCFGFSYYSWHIMLKQKENLQLELRTWKNPKI